MDIDLAQLRALAAAIDGGTFEAAARALHVTPSAISQRIRSLENSVGSVLVQRGKPITATTAGVAYVRLARQVDALAADAAAQAPHAASGSALPSIPLAINGDSLATWVMPALAGLAGELAFDIHREDQDHSAQLLRDGSVMAAITTEVRPVQGCTATRLGVMRYRPMATPAFVERWLGTGTTDELAHAPMVVFDRKDDIQHKYLRSRSRAKLEPPRHYVPVSADFAEAVRLGFGWAMLPELQAEEPHARGDLVELRRGDYLDVTLYWQQWALHTSGLERVAEAITRAAASALT